MSNKKTSPRGSGTRAVRSALAAAGAWQRRADKAATTSTAASAATARSEAAQVAVTTARQEVDTLRAAVKAGRKDLSGQEKALAVAGKTLKKAKARVKDDEQAARAAGRKAARAQDKLDALPVPASVPPGQDTPIVPVPSTPDAVTGDGAVAAATGAATGSAASPRRRTAAASSRGGSTAVTTRAPRTRRPSTAAGTEAAAATPAARRPRRKAAVASPGPDAPQVAPVAGDAPTEAVVTPQ
jgi:hypothetical protein